MRRELRGPNMKNVGFGRPETGSDGQGNRRQDLDQQRPLRPPIPEYKTYGKEQPRFHNKINMSIAMRRLTVGKKKHVRLCVDEDQEVVFQGQRQTRKFLTFMQTTRLLRQGCEAYLAHVVDVEKQVLKMEEIPVVNEFPEVFPDELPGLPPDR
ncbi:hypothetical protein POM88_050553 [Heracleum sosnowskyi]|uniref:Uncharacterized protein n=1 Tax=Heracleum sosnowskyi TaxID=360622 RepID=A0AAD8H0B0_9APIA|nr:hypothetical protein POM88_050553 [Heracleum sosnowskyi]